MAEFGINRQLNLSAVKTFPTHDQIRERLLADFQRELKTETGFLGWLWRSMGKKPETGYVEEVAGAFNLLGPKREVLRLWRITSTSVEELPPTTSIPSQKVIDRSFYDYAHFRFSLPDDSGFGTIDSLLGPRYGSGSRYRIGDNVDGFAIHLQEPFRNY